MFKSTGNPIWTGLESQCYTSNNGNHVPTSYTRSKSVQESPVELFIQDEHNKKWANEGSDNNNTYQTKISRHRLLFPKHNET